VGWIKRENMNRLNSKDIISQVLQDIRFQALEYVLKVRQTASSMKVLGQLVYSREKSNEKHSEIIRRV